MTKTLWCEIGERTSNFDLPKYKKVTAEKVEEIEDYKENLYKDSEGNFYITHRNTFKRRLEFVKIDR